ncbi:MAG: VWA domain-containing protein [Bacteroidia bacterium]
MSFNYEYANPEFFYLLLLVPLFIVWYIARRKKQLPKVRMSSLQAFAGVGRGWKPVFYHSMFLFRILAFSLLVVALARPQTVDENEKITTEGIDIMLALDVSPSMLAQDFDPDRLEAAKAVASDFISGRPNDRIGLVIFAAESFTQSPITTDHYVLRDLLQKVRSGWLEDGTAIGMGLATAADRLKDSESKSKVIILLTDGENNSGSIDPKTAAEIAARLDIRVYTIGIGKRGHVNIPYRGRDGITRTQRIEVRIDEELLNDIAATTEGRYYRATDERSLREIYNDIDQLEKSEIEIATSQRKTEEFHLFALLAGCFFFVEVFSRFVFFKTVP